MNTVDFNFPASQRFFFQSIVQVIIRIGVATYTVVWVILVLPCLLLFSLYYTKYFIRGLKETRRIESVTNSPLLSHLGETISGVRTIRAFWVEPQFLEKMYWLQEVNMQSNLLNKYVYNWFFLRMNLFSIFVMIVSYTLCLVLKSNIDPVLIGMVLVNIGSM